MLYIDTSVVLAELFAESNRPSENLWNEMLFASRLLEVEVWCSIRRRGLRDSHGMYAHDLLNRIDLIDITPDILEVACRPIRVQLRAMDAIHVATLTEARMRRPCSLVSYDREMLRAAEVLGIEVVEV